MKEHIRWSWKLGMWTHYAQFCYLFRKGIAEINVEDVGLAVRLGHRVFKV